MVGVQAATLRENPLKYGLQSSEKRGILTKHEKYETAIFIYVPLHHSVICSFCH
jgi:hypothetical protein